MCSNVKICLLLSPFFFFNDTATTEIYTLSLHDALPISPARDVPGSRTQRVGSRCFLGRDRKSTRLNSSHVRISYAVFCLKKKKLPPQAIVVGQHALGHRLQQPHQDML